MKNLRVLSIGWENTQQNSRDSEIIDVPLGKKAVKAMSKMQDIINPLITPIPPPKILSTLRRNSNPSTYLIAGIITLIMKTIPKNMLKNPSIRR
jgi:hypothetical protein